MNRFENYLHENLMDPVLTQRNKNRKLLAVLFLFFMAFTIAIPIIYYNLYIHNQLQRVDIAYADRGQYDLSTHKLTCDCSLPIIASTSVIMQDPDLLQPNFKYCLLNSLVEYYPPILAVGITRALMINILGLPINDIQGDNQIFNNIIISDNSTLLNTIGSLVKLRYANSVYRLLSGFTSIYITKLLEQTNVYLTLLDQNISDINANNNLFQIFILEEKIGDILLKIVNCTIYVDFDSLTPSVFIHDVTERDCYPVDCHLYLDYDTWQTILLIVAFYLAVVGYFIFLIQCIYQKHTQDTPTNNNEASIELGTVVPAPMNAEAPIAEAPIAEAPIAETPIAEAPIAEAPNTNDK